MNFIETNIKWIMLASGLITCTMILAVFSPQLALEQTFGQTLEGPLADLVVRSWGALITLIGGMLIFGAYRPVCRSLVLCVAIVSKLVFVGLVLTVGNQYLGKAAVAVTFDVVVVALFILYLIRSKSQIHNT